MNRPDLSNLDRARVAWGSTLPEWVRLLAVEADRGGQKGIADRLGVSSGYVSRILNAKYTGSYEEAGLKVRALLSADTVDCPAFGPIPLRSCIRNRRREGPAINGMQRIFDRYCPECPFNTDRKEDGDD